MTDAKTLLLTKRPKLMLSRESALSTGSTLLNLACTDTPDFGFPKGKYIFLVGDSTSGKTFLSLTCMAESQINKHFSNYRLILDEPEEGAMMDIKHYFGKRVAEKLERVSSESIEDFYHRMDDLIKEGKPFIYVLDSQDALDSKAARKKFGKQKKAAEEGEEAKGSYGDGKAKYHSENIRWVLTGVRKTKSILIIIGQTRDNINPFSFEKKTRSGGRSLKFYATIEAWSSVGKKIKKNVKGVKRVVGSNCIVEIKKNRITGKTGRERAALIPIYDSYGIDDVGSCVDFLIFNKHWKKAGKDDSGTTFKAPEIDFVGTRGQIIHHVEKNGKEPQLKQTVATVWQEIEDGCQLVNRKRRYE